MPYTRCSWSLPCLLSQSDAEFFVILKALTRDVFAMCGPLHKSTKGPFW